MSRYQKYQAYKDSGVEWIGKIPEHWETTKIRFYYDVQLGKMLQPESKNESDFEVKYLKAQHVQWNQINLDDLPTMWATEREIEKFSVQQGDLLICEGGEVGRSALLDEKIDVCIIQNALHRVRAKEKSCVKYLQYFMQHVSNALWFDILCNKATIAHLTGEKLAALDFPLPPLEEQQAITYFLDRKTAQIDELIAKKEALLEKLDEKRTALITRVVTKGLDPSAPMKESGLEWLGEIPAHWEVKRLKYIASCNDECLAENTDTQYEIKYIDISSVNLSAGITHKETLSFEKAPSRARRIVRHGDTIVSTVRTYLKTIAPIIDPEENLIVSTGFAVIRPKEHYSSCFLGYFLQTEGFVGQVVANSVGVSYPAINANELLQISVIVPPLEEQQALALHIERKTATIEHQKAQVTEAIERLKEYRTALITDAVTGKMDVHSHRTKESLSA